MRFFIFIILCFFSFSVYAEQLKIEDGVFINIPDNKVYTVINANELVKGVIEARDLTQQESAIVEFIHKKGGQSSDDVVYYIQSQKNKEFYEKEDDPFGKAENDILFYRITEKCLEKFTKKGVHKCARREFSSVMNNDPSYHVVLLKNEDPQLKKLNSMSDDELSSLTKKEIKRIRKINSSDIKFKSKGKYFKEKGVRNIKITATGDFYIETMTTVVEGYHKTTYVSYSIPYKNRLFLINGICTGKFCKDIKEKMAKIIEPTFKINTSGTKVYNFQKKQDMLNMLTKVRKAYRAYRFARLILLII